MLVMAPVMMGVEARELRNCGCAPREAALIWTEDVCVRLTRKGSKVRTEGGGTYDGRVEGQPPSLQRCHRYVGLRDTGCGRRGRSFHHLSATDLGSGGLCGVRRHLLHGSLDLLHGGGLRLEQRLCIGLQLRMD